MAINPNLPPPVVLSSNLAPPPVHPVPIANQVVLPVVAAGFNPGPFTPGTTVADAAPALAEPRHSHGRSNRVQT